MANYMDQRGDLYAILGVSRDATRLEILIAHRRFEPKDADDLERMAEIINARLILSDSKLRKIYDKSGQAGLTAHFAAQSAKERRDREPTSWWRKALAWMERVFKTWCCVLLMSCLVNEDEEEDDDNSNLSTDESDSDDDSSNLSTDEIDSDDDIEDFSDDDDWSDYQDMLNDDESELSDYFDEGETGSICL